MATFPIHGMLDKETHAGAVAKEGATVSQVVLQDTLGSAGNVTLKNEDGTLSVNTSNAPAIMYLYQPGSSYNSASGQGMTIGCDPTGYFVQASGWGGSPSLPVLITPRWSFGIQATPHILPESTTNTQDIGSTTKRVRNLCVGTNVDVAAGTTARAQISLAASTAPTSPANGDIWFEAGGLKIRIGGVTRSVNVT